jgi:hypothetical protein
MHIFVKTHLARFASKRIDSKLVMLRRSGTDGRRGAMADQTLLPDPTNLHLLQIEAEGAMITMVVQTVAPEAPCPLCNCPSTVMHSHYTRLLADLPWMGYAVHLKLHLRRFFCQNAECQRKIFAERLPAVVAPYVRRTLRLHDLFTLIGFTVGGEAGRKLVEGMKLSSSEDYPAPPDPSYSREPVCYASHLGSRRFWCDTKLRV